MQQIVDLQNDPAFQALDVEIVSIALDSAEEQEPERLALGISDDIPMLVDADSKMSADYDVLKWAIANGEPGHTFILVGADGKIAWIKDYGAPDLADRTMYVEVDELTRYVSENIQ